jgi:hypothetical protein
LVRWVQARLLFLTKAAQAERLLFLVVLCPPSRHWAAVVGEVVLGARNPVRLVVVVAVAVMLMVQAVRLREVIRMLVVVVLVHSQTPVAAVVVGLVQIRLVATELLRLQATVELG